MDSFLSVSVELILLVSGFVASKMTVSHFLHSSALGVLGFLYVHDTYETLVCSSMMLREFWSKN
jgi:hypothetical protein